MSSPRNSEESQAPSPSGQQGAVDEVFLSSQWDEPDKPPFGELPPELLPKENERLPIRRRIWLPLMLFVLTMFSTFLAGATHWVSHETMLRTDDPITWRLSVLMYWRDGLIYMG